MPDLGYCVFARALIAWAVRHLLMVPTEAERILTAIERIEFRLAACAGKRAFISFDLANQVAKRGNKFGGFQRHPYRCHVCTQYHLGSTQPARRRGGAAMKQKLRRAREYA